MTTCAVVRYLDNIVVNTIIADPNDLAPEDCFLVEMTENNYGQIGDTWDGTNFIRPSTE